VVSPARRILAFDEDASFLKTAGDLLKAAGLEFLGVQELPSLVSRVLEFKPHLILLNRSTPGGAAVEAARALRTSYEAESVPLVFVLADSSERELIRALQARAREVILKPFGPVHVERINKLLDDLATTSPISGYTWEDQVAHNFVDIARRHALNGALLVNRGAPFEGRISFREGTLVRAKFGPLSGMDAIREILQLEEGVFEMDAALERPPPKIAHSATELEQGKAFSLGPGDMVDIRPRVLAVEDQPELLNLVSKHLARAGFEVMQARDGVEGVEAALATPFDLIVSDLNMPRMDGWEMIRALKADHRTAEVPVIVLSAYEDFRETLRAAQAGAYDYLAKAKSGLSEAVITCALGAITPRLEALFGLLVNEPLTIRAQTVGIQWALRALARLKSTGVLALQDDWGSYRLEVKDGQPVQVRVDLPHLRIAGVPAFAKILMARHAQGSFTHVPVSTGGPNPLTMSMEELIQRTCDQLNSVESRALEKNLAAATDFDMDPELYDLFRKVAVDWKRELARAVCELKVPPADLARTLNISPEQVTNGLRDLIRRGVIKPRGS
jgi:DNA-binding response OmpR family regulator